jgi:hypothetical protein
MDDIESEPDEHWSDVWYEAYDEAVSEGEFLEAISFAVKGALEARRQYRSSGDKEDRCHGAFFWLLAAKAADKAGETRKMIRMYFMSQKCFTDARKYMVELSDDFRMNLTTTHQQLKKLRTKVASLGVDPDMDPAIFITTEMRMDGYDI